MAHHWCPCPSPWESLGSSSDFTPEEHYYYHHRLLQEDIADEETAPQGETWQMVYVGLVLLIMFGTLLLDIIGVSASCCKCNDRLLVPYHIAFFSQNYQADLVMLAALTACMASNIITVDQGLSGFSNEGVLTVLVSTSVEFRHDDVVSDTFFLFISTPFIFITIGPIRCCSWC